ncbi:MAG: diguanylate cyclase [Treponema sp.]|nr:diguanylate cyclase [Treponema sp.]
MVKKNTLLIVDDEKMNIKVLTNILISEYNIFTATNGKDAVEKASKYKPDLILLDILMPEMDGYQALSEMRKCEIMKKIPVIFITGLNSLEDEEKGLSLDAADYITKPFSDLTVKIRVRNQIQIINQLRTIEHLSMIDQLTDLPNRRCFDDRLSLEWKQAIREQTPISMLVIDIDDFKNINDTYGHQQGDIVLQTIAAIFTQVSRRPGDFAARWGGEEFIVLLPNTSLDGAMDIAERIRADIEHKAIPDRDGSTINVTVSIGVNSQIPVHDSSANAFFADADKALYAAKDAGKNRVVHLFLLNP